MAFTSDVDTNAPRYAYEIVGPEIESMTDYADSAYDRSVVFLEELLAFISETPISNVNVSLEDVGSDIPPISLPSAPTAPNLSINIPNLPSEFVPGNIAGIDLGAIGSIPTFNTAAPSINIPSAPVAFSGDAPSPSPTIKDDFSYPDAPSSALPSVPTFEELNIPESPTLNIPIFDQLLPSASTVVVPNQTFSWGEESPFSDTCLTAVKEKLCDWLSNGGTGLLPHIEQAIYDRGRGREDVGSTRSEHQVLTEQAARGFSRPQGSTYAALDFSSQETQNKIADLSREIMIKQAEMEQTNIHFAIQQTIALEQALISEHSQIQARSFEAAKFIQDISIQLYNAEISKVTIELDAFKAYSSAYESRVRSALAEVEVFKSEVEAQALISKINADSVSRYSAQVDAIQTSVSIYKTEIESVATQISAEGLKVQNFKGLVQAYAEEIGAKKLEFESYGETIKAELAKVDVFDSQVKAFIGRIDAYGKSVGAQTQLVETDIAVEDLRLRSYLASLDAIVKQIDAETKAYSSQSEVYRGQAAIYQAEIGASVASSEVLLKEVDAGIRLAVAQSEIALKNAEINIKNTESVDALRLEAIKSGADISKGLAQASLAAVHVGASVSSSGQDQTVRSNSYQESHIYQEK